MGCCFSKKQEIIVSTNGYKKCLSREESLESFMEYDVDQLYKMSIILYYIETGKEKPGYEGMINSKKLKTILFDKSDIEKIKNTYLKYSKIVNLENELLKLISSDSEDFNF